MRETEIRWSVRPAEVALVAIYFAGCSVVLLALVMWQALTHQIHAAWQDAILLVPLILLLSLLPGVLGLGLWVLDNAARIACMFLAAAHGVAEAAWLSYRHLPWRVSIVLKIAIDAAIIVCLNRPKVRKAFHWTPVNISLRGPMP